MSKITRFVFLTSLFSLMATHVYAGTCEIKTTRTSCPGKEDLSFKKCDGIASCSEFVEVPSAADCTSAALAACENKRSDVTKLKVIAVTFDEKPLKGPSGSDDVCVDYKNKATEFNNCTK
jgi:hypothetical protein